MFMRDVCKGDTEQSSGGFGHSSGLCRSGGIGGVKNLK